MNLSDLKKFFEEKLSPSSLSRSIQAEIRAYKRGSLERGRTRPVVLVEDVELLVRSEFVSRLCSACIKHEFSDLEVQYIADALLLSNSVVLASDRLRDILESLSDPEVNGPVNHEWLLRVITDLNENRP